MVATQPAPPLAKPSGTTRWGRDDGRFSISKGAAVADVVFGPPCIRGPDSPRSTLGNLTSQIGAQVEPLNASDWPASGRLHGKQAAQRHGPRGPVVGRDDRELSARDERFSTSYRAGMTARADSPDTWHPRISRRTAVILMDPSQIDRLIGQLKDQCAASKSDWLL